MDETYVCLAEPEMTSIINNNTGCNESSPTLATVRSRICLVGELGDDSRIFEAAQVFDVPIVSSATGAEFINDGSWDTVFVMEDFSGPVILGPTALQQYAEKRVGLPRNRRPLYNLAMSGLVICFTGFRKKDELMFKQPLEDLSESEGQLLNNTELKIIFGNLPRIYEVHKQMLEDANEDASRNAGALFIQPPYMVCKKRSKAFNSLKIPNTTRTLRSTKLSNGKPFKHIRLVALSNIKRVIDIKEGEDCHNVFALMCQSNQEMKEKLYSFTLADEETDKLSFLRILCRQMANTVCKADAENFLTSLDSHQLDIDTSDVTLGTLSKALKFASRTKMKVGRASSFNKNPSKLKRAVSTMMSPFGSTTNLTPASQTSADEACQLQ